VIAHPGASATVVILVLKVDLPHDEIDRRLRRAVRHSGERFHRRHARHPRRHHEELGLARTLEQRRGGLEEHERAEGVHLKVRAHRAQGRGDDRADVVCDARVGDDGVEGGDAVLCAEEVDGVGGVCLGEAVDFDDDEFAVGADWEGFQARYSLCAGRISNCCDYGVVGTGEESRSESQAKA